MALGFDDYLSKPYSIRDLALGAEPAAAARRTCRAGSHGLVCPGGTGRCAIASHGAGDSAAQTARRPRVQAITRQAGWMSWRCRQTTTRASSSRCFGSLAQMDWRRSKAVAARAAGLPAVRRPNRWSRSLRKGCNWATGSRSGMPSTARNHRRRASARAEVVVAGCRYGTKAPWGQGEDLPVRLARIA